MTTYETLSIILYTITALIALIMLIIAVSQLKKLVSQVKTAVEANTISRLNALLSIEDAIAERRLKLSEAGIAVAELGKQNPMDKDKLQIANLRFDEAKQMYLNRLDRLCFCFHKGLLNEDELRSEYREVISLAVKDFADEFNTGTPYRNIKKVYEKWADI